MSVFMVGLGGFFGAITRYSFGTWIYKVLGKPEWPYGTLVINVTGCLLIGFILGLIETRDRVSPDVRLLLVTGFLGGYTTFSAFGFETWTLARDGNTLGAVANIALQVGLGLGAVWGGHALAQKI